MYYYILYGSGAICIIAIIICGVSMLTTPESKIVLKPGQVQETVVRKMRRQGKIYIAAGMILLVLIGAIIISVWPNVPGIMLT